jgi:hypothetical protein
MMKLYAWKRYISKPNSDKTSQFNGSKEEEIFIGTSQVRAGFPLKVCNLLVKYELVTAILKKTQV